VPCVSFVCHREPEDAPTGKMRWILETGPLYDGCKRVAVLSIELARMTSEVYRNRDVFSSF